MKILLQLSYLGTNYAGFQVQPGKPTIQSALQDALERLYGERPPVKGCSRTDSGVHALDYYATYETERSIPVGRIPYALDALLPVDIAVTDAWQVPDSFHVRHDVIRKEYEYLLLNSPFRDPFLDRRAYKLPHVLDPTQCDCMRTAAAAFHGEHDFAGFMAQGSKVVDTVRRMDYVRLVDEGSLLRIRVCADGFLYNMVRIIVGTLLEVAKGSIDPLAMPQIIASCDRTKAGFTAPAYGLYLRRVEFREGAILVRNDEPTA